MTCSVNECPKPVRSLGLCASHYKRHQRGQALSPPLGSYRVPFEDRIDKSGSCWEWIGSRMAKGYGRWMPPNGRVAALAHRHSYELVHGPIPDGLQLDHLCRNKSCVNPDHLEPVTAAENLRRAREAVA